MGISVAAVNQVLYVEIKIIKIIANNMSEPIFLVKRCESSNVRYEGKLFN